MFEHIVSIEWTMDDVKNFFRREVTMRDSKVVKRDVFAREKEFNTIAELARRIGKCYRTIHRAVQQGKIKTIRFGSSRMIPRAEVERVLQRGF